MRRKFRSGRGIELGLQPHLAGFYEELTNQYPFDFVIGSVHVVHGMDPYYGEIFEGRSDEEVYKETFSGYPWKIWMQSAVLMCWATWIMWYVMESVRPGSILTKNMHRRLMKS